MFRRNKPTESFCLILFKKLCSLSFIIFIILYTINQFSDISVYPKVDISNHFINDCNITIEFCNANSINVTSCQFLVVDDQYNFINYGGCFYKNSIDNIRTTCAKYEFVQPFVGLIWLNISIEQTNLLNNSNSILNILNSTGVYSEILSIYLKRVGFGESYYNSTYNSFFLANRQVAIIDYSPIITEREILGNYIDLNAHMNILPLSSSQNTIQLGINRRSPTIQYQKEVYPRSNSFISKIGGFFSFLSGVFILLFGTSRIAPWGFMQKYIILYMTCMICRKSLIKNVAKKYVSTAGIPFVEKVSEMPASGTLEDRVQIIETLLKEYYLDVGFLEILKKEKTMYHKTSQEKDLIYTSIDIDDDDDMKDKCLE
ncbi:unnamed protein product [Rhizophagus irregularis]|nr:unnamed protein product [Rhizophagus irregularis]CAB5300741.1 unnamed protein product [Rhizophagus irregularis]